VEATDSFILGRTGSVFLTRALGLASTKATDRKGLLGLAGLET